MIGKLSAGSETAPKCFEGLFPPEIKTVAIVAPSMPGDAPEKIDLCLNLLREAGLNVKIMPHAREGEPGRTRDDIIDVRKRAADLEQAWLDPEVDLILCLRGGWGGIDLIENLDWEKLRRRPAGAFFARPGRALATVLLTAAFVLAAWGMVNANKPPEVRRVEVCRSDLPPELDGLKIVLVADLHVDKISTRAEVEEVVRRTNALDPDVIVLAGDFADGRVEKIGYKLAPLKKLRAKYGVYGIPGNHEYYSGYAEWMPFLRSLGIVMLENRHVMPAGEKLALGGVTDPAAKIRHMEAPDIEKTFRGAPEGSFKLLLAHQLKDTRKAAELGVNLQLSGHTHGGMIAGMDRVLALLNHGFVSDMYTVGDMQLYVSRGTSLWKGFPVRLGVPAEITCITLRRK